MKNLLLISVFAILTLSSCVCAKFVETQDAESLRWQAGDINLGGKLAYSSTSQGDNKDSEIKINPSAGFLLSDKLEVAANLGYTSGKSESGSFEDKYNSISVGPSIRYFPCNEWRFLPYIGGEFNYVSHNFDTANYKQTGFSIGADLGFDIFINRNFIFTAGYTAANFQSLKDDRDGVDNINSFNLRASTNRFRLGFLWNL